ncbi:melanoma-associated antigen B10 [Bos taurus]|uniref:MAGE domain-containing protein n=1 Tax=Bos taurus TaxID=9913 RepID=A0AAA9SZ57_BOVIN|nr:melanoma-associated antigen B10 [Bos taurus]DAA12675.1 TPA: melanoma antigen family B, 4-like [Bos taurus]
MPRGQKSKLRARAKRRQARQEPSDLVEAQPTEPEEEEFPSSPSPSFEDVPQSSAATGTSSSLQVPGKVCSTTTVAASVSDAKFSEGATDQGKERPKVSQSKDTTEQSSKDLVDEKVPLLVNYLLYKYQMKEPVTKRDMLRKVIHKHKNLFSEILKKASEHLELLFGLDVKETDPNRGIYVLVNKLELGCDEKTGNDREIPKTGLLMIVLGVILTKGNCATEEQVWKVLNLMELYEEKKDRIYGDVKRLITKDLVQKKYLEYRQVANSDPPVYEFLWGPRAYSETTKMKVLEFVARIHGKVPAAFPSLYEEALKDEEERAQARASARARTAALARARTWAKAHSSSSTK